VRLALFEKQYGWPPFPTIKPRANWSSATAKSSGRK